MDQHSRLDRAIDNAVGENRLVGAVVAVARNGETVYRRAAGFRDREAQIPMGEDAIFRLSSVTKPFVATAAMRLAGRGELALDSPVSRWLPWFRPAQWDGHRPDITLHQLMTHTSGLSYRFIEPEQSAYHRLNVSDGMDQPGLSLEANLQRLVKAPLIFTPGQAWRYSLGMDVVGAVLEAATGKRLDAVVRDEVTLPLGLVDTGFSVTDPARLVTPYAESAHGPQRMEGTVVLPLAPDAGGVRFTPSRVFDPASGLSGGAGMVGTADETLRLLELIRSGGAPLLQSQTVAMMMKDHVGADAMTQGPGWGFGYGWAVLSQPQPGLTPQAAGTLQWGGVYGHSWFVDPVNQLSVVALTNTAFEGMSGRFVMDIRDAVYG